MVICAISPWLSAQSEDKTSRYFKKSRFFGGGEKKKRNFSFWKKIVSVMEISGSPAAGQQVENYTAT